MTTYERYQSAKAIYREMGVDTDAAIEAVKKIPISIHCWQGDDVLGFLTPDVALSGGIQTTGNYPGRARSAEELRADMDFALKMIPGTHRVNLHAIYADTDEKVELTDLEPKHFSSWVDWAKERGMGLDFNPTCFSHPMAESGFTISSADKTIRD
ncbi:MAG: L-rhamnose isomerase, partial [Eubacteriales bacterium]